MKKDTAQKIIASVEASYDTVSKKFSDTRKHFWAELDFIKNYTKDNDVVLDYGCGNGRLLELIGDNEIEYYGVDISQKLLDLAQSKYAGEKRKFLKVDADQRSLSFDDEFFNVVYGIAFLHHLPDERTRLEFLKDIFRVTKKEGRVIFTVWNLLAQEKYKKDLWINRIKKCFGLSKLGWNDAMISFQDNQGVKVQRYYHAFTKDELENLFIQAVFEIEKCELIKNKNFVIVGKKI